MTAPPSTEVIGPMTRVQGSGYGVRQTGCLDRLTWLFVSLGTLLFALDGPSSTDVPHISDGLSGQLPVLRVGGGREAE
jgi:hypothetical protein